MILSPGARLGPYEISGAIGAGGMGEVFRARDTKLNRDVAIKVLPAEFAQDHERVARFKREAQVLASLNHPNIAAIHGLEEAGGAVALVMELVEGEDLAVRLQGGALPLDEAMVIARQIAEGLEEAHERGIIHRDLKPANVKVTPEGRVKILDFGLAKAFDTEASMTPGSAQLSHSPTLSRRMTEAGMIMGTAAYMSPEQARGRTVDRRTDIWAFGVVLYEMLTARRLFAGESVADTLAAVLRHSIDWSLLPTETPASLRRLLRRCLERDRAERLADMGTARAEIKEALSGESAQEVPTSNATPTPTRPTAAPSRLTAGLAALSFLLTLALAMGVLRRPASTAVVAPTVRFAMVDGARLKVATWTTTPFGTSRDGKTIVFNADDGSGGRLWVRTLDQPEPRTIPDTDRAYQPAISPDGEWVAFVVDTHVIRKSRLSGGGATTVTTSDDLTAAIAWTSNDEIVFERIGSDSGIQRVSANGGPAQLLIPIDKAAGESSQRRPLVLPDERLIIYTSRPAEGATRLAAFSLDDGRHTRLDVEGIQALGMVDGQLVYARSDGVLMAVPFDVAGLRVFGTARQLSDRVAVNGTGTAVTLSPAGTLVYALPASPLARLMLGDTAGHATSLTDAVKGYGSARFSPDERRIAAAIAEGDNRDLWIIDRASKEATRLTRVGNNSLSLESWMPDGKDLLFRRDQQLWIVPVDGSAEPRRLLETAGLIQGASPSPDGHTLLVSRRVRNHDGLVDMEELVSMPIEGPSHGFPVVASRSSGRDIRPLSPRVSRDGRFVAFQGRNEQQVHVRSLDGPTTVQVSDATGDLPAWGRDSHTLFYQAPSGLMAAELQTSPILSVVRRLLLPAFPVQGLVTDVSADGKSFLIVAPVDPTSRVMVVLNWTEEVRRQLSGRTTQP